MTTRLVQALTVISASSRQAGGRWHSFPDGGDFTGRRVVSMAGS